MRLPWETIAICLLASMSSAAYSAGACTYQEAIMALERGNTIRGVALMRMAHQDGDKRATWFLVENDYPMTNRTVAGKTIAPVSDAGTSIYLTQTK